MVKLSRAEHDTKLAVQDKESATKEFEQKELEYKESMRHQVTKFAHRIAILTRTIEDLKKDYDKMSASVPRKKARRELRKLHRQLLRIENLAKDDVEFELYQEDIDDYDKLANRVFEVARQDYDTVMAGLRENPHILCDDFDDDDGDDVMLPNLSLSLSVRDSHAVSSERISTKSSLPVLSDDEDDHTSEEEYQEEKIEERGRAIFCFTFLHIRLCFERSSFNLMMSLFNFGTSLLLGDDTIDLSNLSFICFFLVSTRFNFSSSRRSSFFRCFRVRSFSFTFCLRDELILITLTSFVTIHDSQRIRNESQNGTHSSQRLQ